MEPLKRALEKRGWSYGMAARRLEGITEQQLRNLAGAPGATRTTLPSNVRGGTMLYLIEQLWPDLQLADFQSDTHLEVRPRDAKSRYALERA